MKMLIIEDNQDCVTLYRDIFGEMNDLVVVNSLSELEELISQFDLSTFDIAISDLRLDDGHFLDWIEINKSQLMERVPTIIVSSSEDLETLQSSFEWGASDYLIKPFRQSELIVKAQKAQRKYKVQAGTFSKELIMDELTFIQTKIFHQFLNHSNQYISREKLTESVWKKANVNSKSLDVHLSNLRRKLQATNWLIVSSADYGWKLVRKS